MVEHILFEYHRMFFFLHLFPTEETILLSNRETARGPIFRCSLSHFQELGVLLDDVHEDSIDVVTKLDVHLLLISEGSADLKGNKLDCLFPGHTNMRCNESRRKLHIVTIMVSSDPKLITT